MFRCSGCCRYRSVWALLMSPCPDGMGRGSCPKVSTCYKCMYLQADPLLGDELGADAGGKLGVEARWHACQKGL